MLIRTVWRWLSRWCSAILAGTDSFGGENRPPSSVSKTTPWFKEQVRTRRPRQLSLVVDGRVVPCVVRCLGEHVWPKGRQKTAGKGSFVYGLCAGCRTLLLKPSGHPGVASHPMKTDKRGYRRSQNVAVAFAGVTFRAGEVRVCRQ